VCIETGYRYRRRSVAVRMYDRECISVTLTSALALPRMHKRDGRHVTHGSGRPLEPSLVAHAESLVTARCSGGGCAPHPMADARPPAALGHLPPAATQRRGARRISVGDEARRESRGPPHERVAEEREESRHHHRASVRETDVRGVDVVTLEQRRF